MGKVIATGTVGGIDHATERERSRKIRETAREMRERAKEMKAKVLAVREAVANANHSEIARNTGISLSHVSRVLNGKRNPSMIKLAAIAPELGTGMEELFAYLTSIREDGHGGRTAA